MESKIWQDDLVYEAGIDHGQGEHTYDCQGGEEGGIGMVGEFRVGTCKLLHLGMDGQWSHSAQCRELCVIRSLCCTTETEETLKNFLLKYS